MRFEVGVFRRPHREVRPPPATARGNRDAYDELAARRPARDREADALAVVRREAKKQEDESTALQGNRISGLATFSDMFRGG